MKLNFNGFIINENDFISYIYIKYLKNKGIYKIKYPIFIEYIKNCIEKNVILTEEDNIKYFIITDLILNNKENIEIYKNHDQRILIDDTDYQLDIIKWIEKYAIKIYIET